VVWTDSEHVLSVNQVRLLIHTEPDHPIDPRHHAIGLRRTPKIGRNYEIWSFGSSFLRYGRRRRRDSRVGRVRGGLRDQRYQQPIHDHDNDHNNDDHNNNDDNDAVTDTESHQPHRR
jgi:hypothetical protein